MELSNGNNNSKIRNIKKSSTHTDAPVAGVPLHYAVYNNNYEMAKLLVSYAFMSGEASDASSQSIENNNNNNNNNNTTNSAMRSKILGSLLYTDSNGKTPLHFACSHKKGSSATRVGGNSAYSTYVCTYLYIYI